VAANLVAHNTLGIRIKSHSLLNYWKDEKPLVSTSANISGQPTPKSFKEISPEIMVCYVVNLA
jgi:L-threonylcarbamoyladenylate synthase